MTAAAPTLEFWCGLGSPESYALSCRLRGAAADAGLLVRWRPFLAQADEPAALDRAEADSRAAGASFSRPTVFPRDGAPAARALLACEALELDPGPFGRAVLDANFVRDWDVANVRALGEVLVEIDYDAARVLEHARGAAVEAELARGVAEARGRGWAGAPVLVHAGEALSAADLAPDRLPAALLALRARASTEA